VVNVSTTAFVEVELSIYSLEYTLGLELPYPAPGSRTNAALQLKRSNSAEPLTNLPQGNLWWKPEISFLKFDLCSGAARSPAEFSTKRSFEFCPAGRQS
jgi:hypothetical protein